MHQTKKGNQYYFGAKAHISERRRTLHADNFPAPSTIETGGFSEALLTPEL